MRRLMPVLLAVAAIAWGAGGAAWLLAGGWWVLALAPALAAVLGAVGLAALHAVCDRGSRTGMRVANGAAWGMLAVALAGGLYGGIFVLPSLALLLVAGAMTPVGAHRPAIG